MATAMSAPSTAILTAATTIEAATPKEAAMTLQLSSLQMSLNWPVVVLGLLIVLQADGGLAPMRAQWTGSGNGNGNGNIGNFNGNFNHGNGNGNGFGNNDRSGSYPMGMHELNMQLRCLMQQRRHPSVPVPEPGGRSGLGWFSGTDLGDRS